MPQDADVPHHAKDLLFACQEITLSLCCPSGRSWNGSVWAQNRVLCCLEGCLSLLISLNHPKLLLFALQEITLSLCCPSGSS